MNTVSKTLFLTFLFVLGTISGAMLNDGYGQISDDSDTYDTSARNIGVLTDAQQQSMLNNQSNYGANDNDGDDDPGE